MTRRLSWGILGTGNIANQFSEGVLGSRRGRLQAVASRESTKARQFAQKFQAPMAFGAYEELLNDPEVDAVYVSLPNSMHHEWTLRALRAGKHVLCEKPIAANVAEAEEMYAVATKSGRLLVEAFMYRSHPLTKAVTEAVARGDIGSLRMIRASFCYHTRRRESNIRFDPGLAGGALMDIGCYLVSFTRLIVGESPRQVQAMAVLGDEGVDTLAVGSFRFRDGVLASFQCGMTVNADNTASICGSEGFLEIPIPWKPPALNAQFSLLRSTPPKMDGPALPRTRDVRRTWAVDAGTTLYGLEADDFAAAVLDGAPVAVASEESIENMRVLDELRRQVGLSF
ncbi:Glucose--fructose oxidoreductase precursor [Planctomycetes bacterium Pan216]|uniref:Glucose--fructose oxidoreductase n=1 Tax=Kolteria novifilia TaxID=2527975 RepID=A0A518AYJ5_9BACT|nr:Glucose--fructose oxidoreductase precursor [Planctomycetes bacterium Pan216]